ncbi:MAG: hypothetical protein ACLVB5_15155 [Christensenellales bacterium]
MVVAATLSTKFGFFGARLENGARTRMNGAIGHDSPPCQQGKAPGKKQGDTILYHTSGCFASKTAKVAEE